MGTNLTVHHGVTNIVSKASECLGILAVVEEMRDVATICQWLQVPKDLVQFPGNPTSGPNVNHYNV